jgi:hypothetical protein
LRPLASLQFQQGLSLEHLGESHAPAADGSNLQNPPKLQQSLSPKLGLIDSLLGGYPKDPDKL